MMTDTMAGVNPLSLEPPAETGDTAPGRVMSPAEIAAIERLVR